MIKFIIFIALSSYLTTSANLLLAHFSPICSTLICYAHYVVPHINEVHCSYPTKSFILQSTWHYNLFLCCLDYYTCHIELPLFVFGTGARCRPANTRRLRVEFPIPELGSSFFLDQCDLIAGIEVVFRSCPFKFSEETTNFVCTI